MSGAVQHVPVLPESAPFTPEQRAYLNGFLAGLFSRAPMASSPAASPTAPPSLRPLSILFGSQTGNAERLARRLAREAGRSGFAPGVYDLANYSVAQLASERVVLFVTSTYGDGDPPDNATAFWQFLQGNAAPQLPELRFSVCALGDTSYARFCGFGKDLDARLEQLGAKRAYARADCDVEFEDQFVKWMHAALPALLECAASSAVSPAAALFAEAGREAASIENSDHSARAKELFGRSNPFPAHLVTNRKLNAPGSAKDVRHFEISLEGSGLNYEPGDALAVLPQNDPALVQELLVTLNATGDEAVPGKDGSAAALREALTHHYEITRIPKPLLEIFAARTGDELLKQVTAPEANGELTKFLWGREVIDILMAHPEVKFSAAEFVALLRKLQPRFYSISSSPKVHRCDVHLTVSALRYHSRGRARAGVCSTFLADRVGPEMPLPVFVHHNKTFRPPAADVPLIMVGPGTGIAPFRAFLQERRALGARGKNWLFFGDQKSSTDFLYREEIERFQKDGVLTRLDLAWSRDQEQKIYVQHRLLERAGEVFEWLQEGAAFYVCGDASRMAKDVDAALRDLIVRGGGRTPDQAADYVKDLQAAKRYQRDVY